MAILKEGVEDLSPDAVSEELDQHYAVRTKPLARRTLRVEDESGVSLKEISGVTRKEVSCDPFTKTMLEELQRRNYSQTTVKNTAVKIGFDSYRVTVPSVEFMPVRNAGDAQGPISRRVHLALLRDIDSLGLASAALGAVPISSHSLS